MQDASHRRHAIQIVAALPDSTEDALAVLAFAKELVEKFLANHEPPRALERERGSVVLLSSATKGASV